MRGAAGQVHVTQNRGCPAYACRAVGPRRTPPGRGEGADKEGRRLRTGGVLQKQSTEFTEGRSRVRTRLNSDVTSSGEPSLPAQSTGTGSPALTPFIPAQHAGPGPLLCTQPWLPPPRGKVLTGATGPARPGLPSLSHHCPPGPLLPTCTPDFPEPCVSSQHVSF